MRTSVGIQMAIALALAVALHRSVAFASGVEIRTIGYPNWGSAVRALEEDVSSEGTAIEVYLSDESGSRVDCASYVLQFDAVAQSAFEIGACDSASSTTTIRLAHRALLFTPPDPVPQPLAAGISAFVSTRVNASGGATINPASELRCFASVRPFERDLLHGARVYLSPGRYRMRVLQSDVTAAADGTGWHLEGAGAGSVRVEYEIIDTVENRSVVHDEATLACGQRTVRDAPPPVAPISPSESDGVDSTSSWSWMSRRHLTPQRPIGSAATAFGWILTSGVIEAIGAAYAGIGFGAPFEPYKYVGVALLAVGGAIGAYGGLHLAVRAHNRHAAALGFVAAPSTSGVGGSLGVVGRF